jgi:hypothetical protein
MKMTEIHLYPYVKYECQCVDIHEIHYCVTISSKANLHERYENSTNGFDVDTTLRTDGRTDGHSRQRS